MKGSSALFYRNKQPAARCISALLALAFLLFAAPAGTSLADRMFSYSDAQDARLQALDCLMTCGFSAEWNSEGIFNAATALSRWEGPIRICLTGSPSSDDRQQLNQFIMEIATHCPNVPNIHLVNSEQDADVTIYYGPLNTLAQHVNYYHEGNWGAFSYHYNSRHVIVSGKVGIATDKNNAASKRHLLREELIGVLGLTNDHSMYSDSILYQEWTTVGQLSDVDWLMLNMLYDPDLSCNMSAAEARRILLEKIMR